jgi:hypothetical protein
MQRIFTGLLVAVTLAGSAPEAESLAADGKYVEAIEAFAVGQVAAAHLPQGPVDRSRALK